MRPSRLALLECALRFAFTSFAVLTLATVPAAGSKLWNWEYSGLGITASGTFLTLDAADANGGYLITNIIGTRNGQVITALQPPGTWIPGNEPFRVDDLVFSGPGPQLTSHGFGFATSDGNFSNPFYADFLPSPTYLEFFSTPPFTVGSPALGDPNSLSSFLRYPY